MSINRHRRYSDAESAAAPIGLIRGTNAPESATCGARFRDRLSVGEPLEDVGVGLDLAATRNPCGQPTTSTGLFGWMEFNFLGIVAGSGSGSGSGWRGFSITCLSY